MKTVRTIVGGAPTAGITRVRFRRRCLQRSGFALLMLGLLAARLGADEFFDRVEDALSASAFGAELRARISGTLELEGYRFQTPAPALLQADGADLVAPRMTLFLDSQLGPYFYVFAQSRVDRGFDPDNDGSTRMRLDEYALRVSPWLDGRLHFQVGKFATVVGNWVPRHGAWGNPFITAPLPYENLTGVWDFDAARSSNQLLQWSHVRPGLPAAITANEKYRRLPVIWGPSYAMGAAMFGTLGKFSYAAELKNSALSSRPDEWHDGSATRWDHPTVSGRLGWRPDEMWNLGFSASSGAYLRPFVAPTLPAGRGLGDYRETVLAHDLGFAWHHWQAWAEIFATRFVVPGVGHADTGAYYAEVKYKFTPQFFGAVRWNQQLFGTIPDRVTGPTTWGRDAWRIDLGPGYRFSPHSQFKLQYSVTHETAARHEFAQLAAVQFMVRF